MYKVVLLYLIFFLSGCSNTPSDPICNSNNAIANANGVQFYLEVACTDKEKSKGLMFRENLNKDSGMIFVYSQEDYYAFWMKNTNIPLTIAFLDKDKKIIDIAHMQPHDLTPVVSKGKALYAIEMTLDWFSFNRIKIGDEVKIIN